MSRILKPEEKHHVLRLASDFNPKWEIHLVKGGRRGAYLWSAYGTYSGAETLRRFAKAILKEIPERKR